MKLSPIEALETRIAPATLINPLPDLVPAAGTTGAVLDLGNMFDENAEWAFRTRVEFITNYDSDPMTEGLQAGKIVLELFDELAPLTVQNFLSYVNYAEANGDYDGTFFHRSLAGFVLQGGGFDVTDLASHILTGPNVHNEYSPDRSNLAGTIAMAKTDLSPHTATSEFFINLADNSGTLDEQNGGFTVFGRVIEGMDVVNAIAALPTANLEGTNGALTDTPVQGGYTTESGVPPTASQLVQITDARVTTPEDAVSAGLSFSVAVTGSNGKPTKLVKAEISGDTLNLKYKSSAAGVATVFVTATDASGAIAGTDEFKVTLQPNLVTTYVATTLSSVIVPGDRGFAGAIIENTSGGSAKGVVDVKFYLSHSTENDPMAVMVDDVGGADILIGQASKAITVPPGEAIAVAGKVHVPAELFPDRGGLVRLIAEVTSPEGSRHIQEIGDYSDDNTSLDAGSVHDTYNLFGNFQIGGAPRSKVPLVYHDADGNLVKVTLTGGGYGEIIRADNGTLELITSESTAESTLTVKTKPGLRTDLSYVSFSYDETIWPMGAVNLGSVNLHGDLFAPAGFRSLVLGDLGDLDGTSQVLVIGAFTADPSVAAKIQLGHVIDYAMVSDMPIASISTLGWWNSPESEPDSLFVNALTSLNSKSVFQANVVIETNTLLKSFRVAGALSEAIIQTAGSVGTVVLGGMHSSLFLVGATVDELNAGLNSFTLERTIGSFTVHRVAGQTYAMSDSIVAAAHIQAISFHSVNPNAPGDYNFGVIADTIGRYQRGTVKLSNLGDVSFPPPDSSGDYRVQIV